MFVSNSLLIRTIQLRVLVTLKQTHIKIKLDALFKSEELRSKALSKQETKTKHDQTLFGNQICWPYA